jgi:hypothetical protein
MMKPLKLMVGAAAVCSLLSSAQAVFPLRLDIDVSTRKTKQNIGAGKEGEAKLEKVQVKVKIKRSGGDVPEGMLHAELYVIGRQIQTGNYGIIDVQKGEFALTADNSYTFEYESPMYTLGKTTGNINVGGTYETYLVVVSGPDGAMIDSRSGRAIKEEGIAFIRQLGKKTMFDKDGNVIGKLENPGDAFKKAIPSATDPGDDD